MITATRACLAAVLLAGPAALAFSSGGFFDQPRLWAALAAWALVLAAALVAERPLPATWPARAALAGLALLTLWTGLSPAWAPLAGPALDDLQRLLLYLGALIAATALLRARRFARAAEPALAAGTLVVVGYGLAGRLLPGIVKLERNPSADGRLEQPLTYWNAMGALAAVGFVLCARLAGDVTRPVRLRAAAAAAAPPLGMGVYLSFSRGALLALAVGVVLVVILEPSRPQLRAAVTTVAAGAAGAAAASAFGGAASLAGSLAAREADGVAVLAIMAGLCALAAGATLLLARYEAGGRLSTASLGLPTTPALAVLLVVLVAGAALAAGVAERSKARPAKGATAARLTSVESNRYEYWRVALHGFEDAPVRGVGSGGFQVEWLRERPSATPAKDAHSLYVETAAELGLVGLASLVLLFAGVSVAAVRLRRRDPTLAAGLCAGLLTWATHAGLDWDWEMPALTLVAVALAGCLLGSSEEVVNPSVSAPRR